MSLNSFRATAHVDVQEEVENEARDYLASKKRDLIYQGIAAAASQVVLGGAAGQILDLARQHGQILVVMASSGRSGLGRALLGSVADRVVCSSAAPVLLVRNRP